MVTILYTNSDSIRSAVGVTVSEVRDAALSALNLDKALLADLGEWCPTHAAIDAAARAASPTEEELAKGRYLELYCMWFCARMVADNPTAFPSELTDGKAGYKRFNVDFDQLSEKANGRMRQYKNLLLNAIQGTTSVVTAPSLFGKATPGYDPVTGA